MKDAPIEQAIPPAGPVAGKKTTARLTWRRAVGAAAIGVLMLVPVRVGEFGTFVIAIGAVALTVGIGLHILVHWAGQISFSHVAFVALGAFITGNLAIRAQFPFWLAIVVATMITVIATVIVGMPALRIRGFHLAITTFAFGLAADRWLFPQTWLSGGSFGLPPPKPSLPGIVFGSSRSLYYVVVLGALAMVVLARKIGRTKIGRAFLAIRADEEVAAAWGINVATYKLLAFAIAGAFAAVGGGLQAYSLGIVGPETFPVSLSVQYVAAVVIGGPGGIWGTASAAALLGVLPILEHRVFGALAKYSTVIAAAGTLDVLTRHPGGLNQLGRVIANRARRWLRRAPAASRGG